MFPNGIVMSPNNISVGLFTICLSAYFDDTISLTILYSLSLSLTILFDDHDRQAMPLTILYRQLFDDIGKSSKLLN
jgi:hypothetical protein